jgi:uncharacterized protein with HEPN domain
MNHDERDLSTLRHIVQYCDEINEAITAHDLMLEKVASDFVYKNALSMCILQIGELVNILSQGFKAAHDSMPWREMKRMRDKAAHHYGEFDVNTLWETAIEDIAPLKEYCLKCIADFEKEYTRNA